MPPNIKNCPIALPLSKLSKLNSVKFIAVHCSASSPKSPNIGVKEIDLMHKGRGFACVGYHFVIKRNGEIERGRPINTIGSHIVGYNSVSLGICMVGGLDERGQPINNFTPEQFASLKSLLSYLHQMHPAAIIQGHRDFSPDKNHDGKITQSEWLKACPCFDVKQWLEQNK